MKRWLRALACAALLWLNPRPEPANACGGPDVTDVGEVIAPARRVVDDLLVEDFEGYDLDDFRMLKPFELAGRDPKGAFATALALTAEWQPNEVSVPKLDLAPWLAAVSAGKLAQAKQAATQLVESVLDLPAPLGAANAEALQRAVEFLELAPGLGGIDARVLTQFFVQRERGPEALPKLLADAQAVRDTPREQLPQLLAAQPKHPRAASLELVRLGEAVHHDLPAGWPGQIEAPAAVWDGLERGYDAWIKAHPAHPLKDLASLSKLRVIFLRGDGKRAWDLLLGMYPRHMLRVVWEMRHLLQAEMKPAQLDLTRLQDGVLVTGLLRESLELSPAQWAQLWKRSEAEKNAGVSINLQERLFVQAIRLGAAGKPPSELPNTPQLRSQRWAELHTAALLAARRNDEALAQARQLPQSDKDHVAAALTTQAYLRQCDFVHAADSAQHLGAERLRYLLEVLADEPGLRALMQRGGALAAQATHALALRVLGDGQWQAAAEVWQGAASESREAKAWREAARLAADTSVAGHLALAKWLLGSSGARIYPDSERGYSRGMKLRLGELTRADATPNNALPSCVRDHERERLVYVLLRGGRRERAFEQYGEALRALSGDAKQTRSVLKEADALYNKLINWDASYTEAFEPLLAASPSASAVREAGKRLRAGGPAR